MSTSGFRGLGFRGAARKHEMQSTAIAALAIYPFCPGLRIHADGSPLEHPQ